MTAPSIAALKFPPTKPVPALRTCNKEKITAQMQTKHLDSECVILGNLRNELERILSGESPGNAGDIRNPRAVKDMFIKFILSKSISQVPSEQRKGPTTPLALLTSHKAHVILAEEAASKARQEKSPVQFETQPEDMAYHLFDSSVSESIQTPTKHHQQPAILLSCPLEDQETGGSKWDHDSEVGLLESLWQERSVVRESEILEHLTTKGIQLQEVLQLLLEKA